MKYIIINDEHELYEVMYADLFTTNEYDVEQLDRFVQMSAWMKGLRELHFNDRINRHMWLPGKSLWNRWYTLSSYSFDPDEKYWVIFLNGTLRNYYSREFISSFKARRQNVHLALVMYDSFSNRHAGRAISMLDQFDAVFSFDAGDCQRYGMRHIWSTFSYPGFVTHDETLKTSAFFVGAAEDRIDIMNPCFALLAESLPNCKFNVVGVSPENQVFPNAITYNRGMPYKEALQYSFNTDLIVEVVREGQAGVSLRTCEAILFNKKLLTNNQALKSMPFYDERFMSVFTDTDDIDLDFIHSDKTVDYGRKDWFSPLNIIRELGDF